MTSHKSFPKPSPKSGHYGGGKITTLRKGETPKAKKTKRSVKVTIPASTAKAKKAPKAGPTTVKKPAPVDEGNGTFFEALTEAEIADRGRKLAKALHEREQELTAQAQAKKLMNDRIASFDTIIHRLQTAIREKREERATPGLFDKQAKEAKEKPLAKDTMNDKGISMAKQLDTLDGAAAESVP